MLFGESDSSEQSLDRMGTAKHLHCRIARPDPVLRSIRDRIGAFRVQAPDTDPRAPRQPTGTAPTERIWPSRGPVSDRPITARPVRRYIAHFRWGGEVQQEEGTNQFNLPGLALQGARTIYTGLTELQAGLGRLSGFAGVRVNHYDDLGTHPTAYGGLAYAATSALTVRASGGNTYRAPAFQELFFIPFSGQPGLEPECSVGADLGIDWSPKPGGRLSLTGYFSRLDGLIQLTFAPELPGLGLHFGGVDRRRAAVVVDIIHLLLMSCILNLAHLFQRPLSDGRRVKEWLERCYR